MKARSSLEKGQSMVLIVLGIFVLFGFTALAIDGGMVYSDRRNAQNAADAAALAAGLQKANLKNDQVAKRAAEYSVMGNGFKKSQITVTITPFVEMFTNYIRVHVELTSTTETMFAKMFTSGPMVNNVVADVIVRPSQAAMPGMAIVAMGNCLTSGDELIGVAGGGNSGGVLSYSGGIFVNTPESGSNDCAIEPGSSANHWGIMAEEPYDIWSIGSYNYDGEDNLGPLPVHTNVNGGVPLSDPLPITDLPEPVCTKSGTKDPDTGHLRPGNWQGAQIKGTLDPGIYCISGDLNSAGNDSVFGNGVVLYFKDGGMRFSGNGDLTLTAPTDANCQGDSGLATESCTYKNIAIYVSHSNSSAIDLAGNGLYKITGLVYNLNGVFHAKGGGTSEDEWVVNGQVIASSVLGDGGGSFVVTFDAGNTYWSTVKLWLDK